MKRKRLSIATEITEDTEKEQIIAFLSVTSAA
jgi:hypothetical protein